MSTRVNVRIQNMTNETVECTNISCAQLTGLSVGDKIKPNFTTAYSSTSNDRIFVQFRGDKSNITYSLAMTCPKLSDNSATGYGNSGLQPYSSSGTPANFEFYLGENDDANWGNGSSIYYGPTYGDCS